MKSLWCTISLLLSLCFIYKLKAQELQVRPGETLYGFSGGFSFNRLDVRGAEKVEAKARPYLGLSASYALSYRWRTNLSGFFAMRSSLIDNSYRVEQTGVDLQLIQQYKIDDLYLNFGFISQSTITSRTTYKGNSNFRSDERDPADYTVPGQTFMPLLGVEFKLMDNWRFFSNYAFDYGNLQSNLQIGVSFRINKRSPPPESDRRRKKRIASRQITQLRDGALLVRLKTSKPTIRAMRARGFDNWADETEKNQRIENLSLINAFRSAYNFSEVKFFYSEDSRKVRKGNFEGIFLNDSLQKDSAIVLRNPQNVFTCELTNIQEDTARFFSHYEWVPTGDFAMKQVPRFYGGGENTFYALVVKDQDFNQLSRPFPYYSRALFKAMQEHPGHGLFFLPLRLFFSDTPKGSVEELNDKLFRFWRRQGP